MERGGAYSWLVWRSEVEDCPLSLIGEGGHSRQVTGARLKFSIGNV